MKEKPILFSGEMVRAILAGTKTQTRRVVKAKHVPFVSNLLGGFLDGKWNQRPMPYGRPGDHLWVRETFATDGAGLLWWRAAGDDQPKVGNWKPSIHMPRWASRITLEITAVRCERLNDISEDDARAEGVVAEPPKTWIYRADYIAAYRTLWESINGPGSWAQNPWVWVIEFKRIKP